MKLITGSDIHESLIFMADNEAEPEIFNLTKVQDIKDVESLSNLRDYAAREEYEEVDSKGGEVSCINMQKYVFIS